MGSVIFTSYYSVPAAGYATYRVRIGYSEEYAASTNKTTVRITSVELQGEGNGVNWGSLPFFGSVRVNGSTLLSLSGGASVRVSFSGDGFCPVDIPDSSSVTVTHDDDGSKSVSFALVGGVSYAGGEYFCALYEGQPFGVAAQSVTVALTAHPRASTISFCPPGAVTGSSCRLVMTRNSSAFYHKARFQKGGTPLYTSEPFATALNFTVPRSWFSSFPNTDVLDVTVSVQTYRDSSCTGAVGAPAVCSLSVTADEGMRPAVASGWAVPAPYNADTAAAGITGYVKGYSRAQVSFDPSKISMSDTFGASVASYSVSCQGLSVSASPYRTGVLKASSAVVTCTVTDTRGRSTSEDFPLSVMDYARPKLSAISVFRSDADGTADEGGTYITVRASRSFSSLDGQNSCSLTAACAVSGGAYGSAVTLNNGTAKRLGPVSADTSYSVRIRATDALENTASYYTSVPTRKWAMKFRANGRGVAFGKAAESDDVLEVSSDWAVRLGRPLAIESGGTGAASAAEAVSNLGLARLQIEKYDLANDSSVEISTANSEYGMIVVTGAGALGKEIILYNTSGGGAVSTKRVTNAEGIALSTSTRKITLSNSAGYTQRAIKMSL